MKLKLVAAAVLSATMLTGCLDSSSDKDSPISAEQKLEKAKSVIKTNADIAYAAYSDSVDTAEDLLDAIQTFKADPTQANLDAAKLAWLKAREPYGQTEVYRFRMSPIDSTDGVAEDGPEGDINAWPLGEALIDKVLVNISTDDDFGTDEIGVTDNDVGSPVPAVIDENYASANNTVNIIGSTSITIDETLISKTATADDEHDVIAGYHAIEFLLWGQDLNDSAGLTDGTDRNQAVKAYGASNIANGGQRPLSDFTEATLGDRRLTYLEVAAQKLVNDLTQVRDAWKPNTSGNYYDKFVNVTTQAEADAHILEILVGMGTLSEGELAGERMQIALVNNSQEDEHSCFSDNTHRDIWLNAEGVSNAYFGKYDGYDANLDGTSAGDNTNKAVDGYGIYDYLKAVGEEDLAEAVKTKLATTETHYKSIDTQARAGNPFDVLIQDLNADAADPVKDTILALNAQASSIADIAIDLGLADSADDVVDPDASACNTSDPDAEC